MDFLADMVFPTLRSCVVKMGKDSTTWVGSVTSVFANIIAVKDGFFPSTLEGWLADCLTLCTITYMIFKMSVLFRKEVKKVNLSEE